MRRVTLPATGRMLPAIARSRVVLPQPDGPTTPTNSRGADPQIDVDQHVLGAVAARDALDRDERRAHCGYSAVSGATFAGVNSFSAVASPPIASVIVT